MWRWRTWPSRYRQNQVKRRGGGGNTRQPPTGWRHPQTGASSKGTPWQKEEEQPRVEYKPFVTPRPDPTSRGQDAVPDGRSRDRKRFGRIASECPNRRVMVTRDSGEVVTDEECETDPAMAALEDPDEGGRRGDPSACSA